MLQPSLRMYLSPTSQLVRDGPLHGVAGKLAWHPAAVCCALSGGCALSTAEASVCACVQALQQEAEAQMLVSCHCFGTQAALWYHLAVLCVPSTLMAQRTCLGL